MNCLKQGLKQAWMLTVCLIALSALAQAQNSEATKWPLVEREREIAWALSGGPEHLRADAGVYVLQRGGYVRVRESRNGFNCLVNRVANITAPQCYDAEGSETNMKADMRRVELIEQGKSAAEASQIIKEEYRTGKLLAPRKPGITYMLSEEFVQTAPKTGERKQVFVPHLMFYAPYLKNADIGAQPEHHNSHDHPFVLGEGTPGAYIIVVPKDAKDSEHKAHGKDEAGKKVSGTLTAKEREFLVGYLQDTRQSLLADLAGLSAAQLKFKPNAETWSIAENVEHIVLVEENVYASVTEKILKSPARPEWKGEKAPRVNDLTPIVVATNRTARKFKAPETLRPVKRYTTAAEARADFEKTRAKALGFAQTTNDDLRAHFADNPIVGTIDAYQWLLFVAAHGERHRAQIAEVKAHSGFPKTQEAP